MPRLCFRWFRAPRSRKSFLSSAGGLRFQNGGLTQFLLEVALPSVTKCQSDAERHHSERRHQKYNHTFADSLLSVLGSCFGGAATHGTALAEGGRSPQQEHRGEKCGANSHFTPNDSIRKASGKKKIVIRIRQATTEHMVSHFIRDTSYFRCMKKPMISAALMSDNPIKIVSIFVGCMF